MKNICFIGPPGCGKSTQIKQIRSYISAHFPVFLAKVTKLSFLEDEVLPYVTDEEKKLIESKMEKTRSEKRNGELADIFYDELLFRLTKRIPEHHVVIFDGSPRSLTRAALFLTHNHLAKDSLVFHFQFSEHEYEHSISRQIFRGLKYHPIDVVKSELDRFQRKIEIYQNDTSKGIELLRENGVKICSINAMNSINFITEQLKQEIDRHLSLNKEKVL